MGEYTSVGPLGINAPSQLSPSLLTLTAPAPTGTTGLASQPAQTSASLGEKVLQFATSKLNTKVGRGECWDLAEQALKVASAKTSNDYGKVKADSDYVWGLKVELASVQAGDIIQFRNYKVTLTKTTETSEGIDTQSKEIERPHHTAIVEKLNKDGSIQVIEQNIEAEYASANFDTPDGANLLVRRSKLYFSNSTTTSEQNSEKITLKIEVTGKFWFYSPQLKP